MKKIIFNWFLIVVFFVLIFIIKEPNIALFILCLLWIGNTYTTERHRKFIHVFQVLNDIRFFAVSKKIGITAEEGQAMSDEVEMERLSEIERKRLHKDMDDLGL